MLAVNRCLGTINATDNRQATILVANQIDYDFANPRRASGTPTGSRVIRSKAVASHHLDRPARTAAHPLLSLLASSRDWGAAEYRELSKSLADHVNGWHVWLQPLHSCDYIECGERFAINLAVWRGLRLRLSEHSPTSFLPPTEQIDGRFATHLYPS